ncbi:TIGR03618 family F420-dependent PPOX class oxidoreductase [Umezawaea tangerina]|uniref:PPOX class probable F420-dependent enzyme n=1 Tax=Umezawaea tangerina TaxID=84725 RepID=A0A2T0TGY0_9PSEU|nr:TIGR03618 family F420-dependent PPOX class oxidoreductase [Umezawaea tangerina]PRY44879.1 PPOX class probable F420-dependent enzyme [Umezawaea tangerina]
MTNLPDGLLALLHRPSPCFISTTMPDGSPHLTQTWVDTDGDHILVNSVQGYRKVRNIERDPRVAVSVCDPDDTSSYYGVRGRVVSATTEGAAENIEKLAMKYIGAPYPWFGGRDQVRVLLAIAVDKVVHAPRELS